MAKAGLLARQDAEHRENLDARGAFAKRRARSGMIVINHRPSGRAYMVLSNNALITVAELL